MLICEYGFANIFNGNEKPELEMNGTEQKRKK